MEKKISAQKLSKINKIVFKSKKLNKKPKKKNDLEKQGVEPWASRTFELFQNCESSALPLSYIPIGVHMTKW